MSNETITKHIRFSIRFDVERLTQDLSRVLESNWVPHFNTGGYTGNWKAIPLYAKDGDAGNIFVPMEDETTVLKETDVMKDCAYFREVVQYFQFPILSVRLLRLEVGAEIKPHKDHKLGYEDDQFRLHIPIVTNPEVSFILDGERLNMQPGECWYANVNFEHSVANHGTIDRVHLVIDGIRNAWSDAFFFAEVPKESLDIQHTESHSAGTLQRIIEELESHPETANQELIATLKAQLKEME